MLEEFKKFALKGNVLDLAVGVVIGAAFGKIVSSFVANIIGPLVGLMVGGVKLTALSLVLKDGGPERPAVLLNYGIFLQSVFDFLIVALALFMAIKAINSFKKKEEEAPAAPAAPSAEVKLLEEIRDALKK